MQQIIIITDIESCLCQQATERQTFLDSFAVFGDNDATALNRNSNVTMYNVTRYKPQADTGEKLPFR